MKSLSFTLGSPSPILDRFKNPKDFRHLMEIKIFFKIPPTKHLKGGGHNVTQFRKPNKDFINIFKRKWPGKVNKYLNYLNKLFVNKPQEICCFISTSNEVLGGCNKFEHSKFVIYIANKKISANFFMVLFHELCHAYLHNENKIQKIVEKKYRFDIEELLAQLLTLRYFRKSKYVKDMPNTIFKNLSIEKIENIKNAFRKFNGNVLLIDWFKSIYNPNIL